MYIILPFLSVLIGFLIALAVNPKNKKNLKLLLAFSGSFLLTLTVCHLLPDVYEATAMVHLDHDHAHDHEHSHNPIGLFIMLGIVLQIVLEFFSKGAEHGHVHDHGHENTVPYSLFISLCLHALMEGMPVSTHHEMAWGIAIHHLPIAVILTLFFMHSKLSKTTVVGFMTLFAVMTPLGTLLSENIPVLQEYQTQISAVVIGILFHISATIIFESNEGHKFNLAKLSAIIAGILFASFM